MAIGMATSKVTITLEDEQLAAIRALVGQGKLSSVSGFVQHAVTVALADLAGWGATLGLALEQTGGPLSAKERAWADAALGVRPVRAKRRRKAA
jgi:Arc/MetJ-type ribon-helix-helix transcriptional regulator